MHLDGSYYTEEQRRTLIQAWLKKAFDTGRLVADPLASTTVKDFHALYLAMNPEHAMSKNAFGAVVNLYVPPAVRGPGGRWIRPGVRIAE